MNVNVAKLVTAVTAILCMTVLMALAAIDQAVGIPVITTVLGYMLGNGVAAMRSQPVEPVISRHHG